MITTATFTKENINPVLLCNIKIPTENKLISNDGMKLFDRIFEAKDRIESIGYNVMFDMNSNSEEYKPITVNVFFDIDKILA